MFAGRYTAYEVNLYALAFKPSIIPADEPAGNLDSETSQEVIGLLQMPGKEFLHRKQPFF